MVLLVDASSSRDRAPRVRLLLRWSRLSRVDPSSGRAGMFVVRRASRTRGEALREVPHRSSLRLVSSLARAECLSRLRVSSWRRGDGRAAAILRSRLTRDNAVARRSRRCRRRRRTTTASLGGGGTGLLALGERRLLHGLRGRPGGQDRQDGAGLLVAHELRPRARHARRHARRGASRGVMMAARRVERSGLLTSQNEPAASASRRVRRRCGGTVRPAFFTTRHVTATTHCVRRASSTTHRRSRRLASSSARTSSTAAR